MGNKIPLFSKENVYVKISYRTHACRNSKKKIHKIIKEFFSTKSKKTEEANTITQH